MLNYEDATKKIAVESFRLMDNASLKTEKRKANDLMDQMIWTLSVVYEKKFDDVAGDIYDEIDVLEENN